MRRACLLALVLPLLAGADDSEQTLASTLAAARAGDDRAFVCGMEQLLGLRVDSSRRRELRAALVRDPATFEAVRAGGERAAVVEHALARLGGSQSFPIASRARVAELVRDAVTGTESAQLSSLPALLTEAGPRAVPGLVDFLVGDESLEYRSRAVASLVRLGRVAIPALVVRAVGARGELADDLVTVLAAVGDPRAAGALAAIAHDPSVLVARRDRARAALVRLVGAAGATRPPARHWLELARLSLVGWRPATDLGDGAPAWELNHGRLVESSAPGALAGAYAVESAARAALAWAPDDELAWGYLVLAKLLAMAELDAIRVAAGRGHAVVSPSEAAWIERETSRARPGVRVVLAAGPSAWAQARELARQAGLDPCVLEATGLLANARLSDSDPDRATFPVAEVLDPDVRLSVVAARLAQGSPSAQLLDEFAATLATFDRPAVLVVADHSARMVELRETVERAGGLAVPTRSGEHAVALATRFARAAVILIDGHLARPCTAAVVHALASDFRTRRMPVIVRLSPEDPPARSDVYPRSARDPTALAKLIAAELQLVAPAREPPTRRELCREALRALARPRLHSSAGVRPDAALARALATTASAPGGELALEALDALSQWGTANEIDHLVRIASDQSAPVERRALAIGALGSVARRVSLPGGTRDLVEQRLAEVLEGECPKLVRAAGLALGRMRSH